MEIKIEVGDWKVDDIIREELRKAVKDRVDLLDVTEVAKMVADAVRQYIRYGNAEPADNGKIAQMLDKRVAELVAGIDDEFLKNTIMERLVRKM